MPDDRDLTLSDASATGSTSADDEPGPIPVEPGPVLPNPDLDPGYVPISIIPPPGAVSSGEAFQLTVHTGDACSPDQEQVYQTSYRSATGGAAVPGVFAEFPASVTLAAGQSTATVSGRTATLYEPLSVIVVLTTPGGHRTEGQLDLQP